MRNPKVGTFADELEGQDSPVLAVLKYYGSPLTRDEYLAVFYMGDVPDVIPAEDECELPDQFQLATVLEMPMLTDKVQ